MAELYGSWNPATDANLNALPGAKLYTYDAVATTTPKTTYGDPDLTPESAHTNPIIADASGKFPQVFADTGENFYLVLKTSADVLVEDYERVTALGDTGTGTFERDFGAGGRYKLSGTLGVISADTGPPAGDDVGGSGRMGGWNGTQGEALEVDYATVTFTGDVAFGGLVGGATAFPKLTTSGTATAQATVDIPLDPAFERWEVAVLYANSSANGNLRGRLSFDNAATFKDGVADYLYEGLFQTNGGPSSTAIATGDHMQLSSAITVTAEGFEATIRVSSKANRESHVRCNFASFEVATVNESETGQFAGTTNAKDFGKATHLRLLLSTGTLTCEYRVMGLP